MQNCFAYPTGGKFSLELQFTISLKANLLNLNSACYKISTKLSMVHVTYIAEIQTSKFAKCSSPWLGRSIKIIVLCYPVLFSLPIHRL